MSFSKKKDRKRDDGNYIGYRNGLKLNEDIVSEDTWTIDKIKARSEKLIKVFMEQYKL